MTISKEIKEYSHSLSKALMGSDFEKLEDVAFALLSARAEGKWIFLAGNGGSGATASHFANDLVKGLSMAGKKRFKAKSLCDSMPIMTALANDYNYDLIFEEQLKNYGQRDDILIVLSGSGNSPNVVNACKYGKDAGLKVISFTGRDGGGIKELSHICCIAKTHCMEEIEDIHLVWEHALITSLRRRIECE